MEVIDAINELPQRSSTISAAYHRNAAVLLLETIISVKPDLMVMPLRFQRQVEHSH